MQNIELEVSYEKTHWDEVKDFYSNGDNNNGFVFGINSIVNGDIEVQWYQTEEERDDDFHRLEEL